MTSEIAYPDEPPLPDFYTRPYAGRAGVCGVCGCHVTPGPQSQTPFAARIRLVLGLKLRMAPFAPRVERQQAPARGRAIARPIARARRIAVAAPQPPVSKSVPPPFLTRDDLRTAPAPTTPERAILPPRHKEEWEFFVERIETLLEDGGAHWATDTLEGIRESVRGDHRVTEGRKRAVGNIEAAVERKQHSRWRW